MGINRAANWSDFRRALRLYVAPAQNFIFADVEGNIGYQMPGFIPQRKPGHSGKYPVPGNGRSARLRCCCCLVASLNLLDRTLQL